MLPSRVYFIYKLDDKINTGEKYEHYSLILKK